MDESVDETATEVFTVWTPKFILKTFQEYDAQLTELASDVMHLTFDGIKKNQKSIYLTNKKMRHTLLAYDEWEKYIPTGDVGLHKKFKTNAGILSHIIKRIAIYKAEPQKLAALNAKISANTEYGNLDDMLAKGMFILYIFNFFQKQYLYRRRCKIFINKIDPTTIQRSCENI